YLEVNNQDLTLESITREYTVLKSSYSKSVKKLNNLFLTITLFGFYEVAHAVNNIGTVFVNISHVFNIIIFFIIEIVYIYTINRVKNNVDDISSQIGSEKVISQFLARTNLNAVPAKILKKKKDNDY